MSEDLTSTVAFDSSLSVDDPDLESMRGNFLAVSATSCSIASLSAIFPPGFGLRLSLSCELFESVAEWSVSNALLVPFDEERETARGLTAACASGTCPGECGLGAAGDLTGEFPAEDSGSGREWSATEGFFGTSPSKKVEVKGGCAWERPGCFQALSAFLPCEFQVVRKRW